MNASSPLLNCREFSKTTLLAGAALAAGAFAVAGADTARKPIRTGVIGCGEPRHTITIVGSGGFKGLVGYDWAP